MRPSTGTSISNSVHEIWPLKAVVVGVVVCVVVAVVVVVVVVDTVVVDAVVVEVVVVQTPQSAGHIFFESTSNSGSVHCSRATFLQISESGIPDL